MLISLLQLLKTVPVLQSQIDNLLDFDVRVVEGCFCGMVNAASIDYCFLSVLGVGERVIERCHQLVFYVIIQRLDQVICVL